MYAPSEWTELISLAKEKDPRYTVINMTENDFFSVQLLMNLVLSEKHSANGEEIFWSKISSITHTLSDPLNLFVHTKEFEILARRLSRILSVTQV